MTAPAFVRVADRLYELSSDGDSPVAGYWAGYRAKGDLPDPATLDDVWRDAGGAYVFCAAKPTDYVLFVAGVDQALAQLPYTRFVWIADPDADPAYWQLWNLTATSTGSGPTIAWTVRQGASFACGGYAVTVPRFTALTPATEGVALAAAGFDGPDGTMYAALPGSAGIPFSGPTVGCLTGTLTLDHSDPDDMARLDVGLRYSMPDPNDPGRAAVLAVPMPLLAQDGSALTVHLSFDPLFPLVPDRSALGFLAPDLPGLPDPPDAPDPPALRTRLATTLGAEVTLAPVRGTPPQWPARLVFATSPRFVDVPSDPKVYLTPDGTFRLAVGAEGTARLALGLSGLEYVDVGDGAVALFQAGRPAYLPGTGEAALEPLGTTAYVALLPDGGAADLTYYAQPWQSPLYARADDTEFLRFHEMPAATLGAFADGAPPVVPLGAYLGVDPALAPYAATIEQAALAPVRRASLPLRDAAGGRAGEDTTPAEDTALAVTPNGLLARLTADGTAWRQAVLAGLPGAPVDELVLTAVGPRLQALLQSTEAFAVVSDVTEFFRQSSVRYRVDEVVRALLLARGVPAEVVRAIAEAAGPDTYDTEKAFTTQVAGAAGAYLDTLLSVAGLLKAVLQDWTFQLSPRSWRSGEEASTVLLMKFASRSLTDLAADLPSWGWPEAAYDEHGDPRPTQKLVLGIIEDARERAAVDPGGPYARFLREVADNPAWNGVLVLNAPVAVAELPRELQFVTAGIDTGRFYAHHVGFGVTPFKHAAEGGITLGQTAAFGLISYDDPADLCVEPEQADFAFKTQQLSARFANAALADFSARVELMANRLFGSVLTKRVPESGNNLVLIGSYQRQNDRPSYAFTLAGGADFAAGNSVLLGVEVLGVQVQTATGSIDAGTLSVDFVLTGNLRFAELPHADLFSYGPNAALPPPGTPAFDGYLRFGNLVVTMAFPAADPGAQTFTTAYDRMSFDLANSEARVQSLATGFPVRVTGAVANPVPDVPGGPRGRTPEDLGYTGILAPVDAVLLSPPWFGLVLTLDLGSLGALAGSAGMQATLLVAWSPGTRDQRPVYFGLRLAGADATTASWPLQGVLKLGFRGFELTTYEEGGRREYLMRLRHLALSVLAFSFPPGDLDVLVFGDPEGTSSAVGWYAAYDSGTQAKAARRRLAAGRRALPDRSKWQT
ncbi:hypothetical protein OG592_06240 [Streptomyces avidinii]|uniref:hypothetical protein n=1 Tax=Streptomyces avidinii TaxID=1895 RepID=UPI00386E2BBB|nr:hypothetical protein OG592_06240 [Streptomyces avidinii]